MGARDLGKLKTTWARPSPRPSPDCRLPARGETDVAWWALLIATLLTWISGLDYARVAPRVLRGGRVASWYPRGPRPALAQRLLGAGTPPGAPRSAPDRVKASTPARSTETRTASGNGRIGVRSTAGDIHARQATRVAVAAPRSRPQKGLYGLADAKRQPLDGRRRDLGDERPDGDPRPVAEWRYPRDRRTDVVDRRVVRDVARARPPGYVGDLGRRSRASSAHRAPTSSSAGIGPGRAREPRSRQLTGPREIERRPGSPGVRPERAPSTMDTHAIGERRRRPRSRA